MPPAQRDLTQAITPKSTRRTLQILCSGNGANQHTMQVLSPDQLLQLLPMDAATSALMGSKFESIAPVSWKAPGMLAKAVADGWMFQEIIAYKGQNAFAVWYHISGDNGLWVNAVCSFDNGADIGIAFDGCTLLRQKHSAGYIRFMTTRKGLVAAAKKRGFTAEGVILFQP